jgi:misacylated tRNA(Ala) deacylase
MTELLYYSESYLKQFDATVTDVVAGGVVLNRTAFYVGGGGQPADSGVLTVGSREYSVTGIKRVEGQFVHLISGELPSQSSIVRGQIDWERRYLLMRTHSALHILCGVVWRDYGARVTGGDMKPGEGRMDFEFESFSAEFVDELEAKVNAEVEKHREIRINHLSREEADQEPDLIRTKVNLLPSDIQEIRTIDIDGLDLQADGGTHVANTQEVGTIQVVGHESKGRINKRIRIALED